MGARMAVMTLPLVPRSAMRPRRPDADGRFEGTLPQDRLSGQGQRTRALPVVWLLGRPTSGAASAFGVGATTTVAGGLGFFFFAGCGGGAGCSGDAVSVPMSVGGLSSGFGAEASASGAS